MRQQREENVERNQEQCESRRSQVEACCIGDFRSRDEIQERYGEAGQRNREENESAEQRGCTKVGEVKEMGQGT